MKLRCPKSILIPIAFLMGWSGIAQSEAPSHGGLDQESYREDQFYIGLNYNVLSNVPTEVAVRGISGGLSFGFIRDMPLVSKGNLAIGLGGGFSFDRYGQNIKISTSPDSGANTFEILTSPSAIDQNRLSVVALEVPLELRWRTSTLETYKFWRIYSGIKWSYSLWNQAYFKGTEQSVSLTDLSGMDPSQFYYTLSLGYGTFNAQLQYGLGTFFSQATEAESAATIGITPIKIGMVFYLL
ncbi:MAG: porin family protein [Flavobacteriaceae bacterium]|mgnify:CR=1 FL=1|jgi:hypothetical protein